jgi:Cdc6-like AAA superfamily ATPase
MASVWEELGFVRNPFEPLPLTTPEEIENLFVGREKEVRELKGILSSPTSRTVVEADAGYGKTTFVNRVFYELSKERKDFLVIPRVIGIESAAAGAEAKYRVALELISRIESIGLRSHLKRKFKEIVRERSKLELQLSLFAYAPPLGAQLQIGRKTEFPRIPSYLPEVLVSRISDLIPELGLSCAVVALNNLDALPDALFGEVLNELRDFIQTRNLSFVLLAGRGFYRRAEIELPRWRGVLSAGPIELIGFSKREIEEILDRRVKYYSKSERAENPFEPSLLSLLIECSGGNLRWLLSTLSYLRAKIPTSVRIVNKRLAETFLKARAESRLQSLTRSEQKVIQAMVRYGKEVYSADCAFQKLSGLKQAWLFQLLTSLERKGELSVRWEGLRKMYSLHPDYKFLAS